MEPVTRMLRRGTVVMTAALAAFLLLSSVISYYNLHQLRLARDRWTQSVETLLELRALFSALQDAESSQRGYLLIGDRSYLAPYEAAAPRVRSHLRSLSAWGENNPQAGRSAQRLVALGQEKLAELAETIRLQDASQRTEVMELLRTHRGKEAMDEIRALTIELADINRAERTAASHEIQRLASLSVVSLVGATIISLTLLGFMVYLYRKQADQIRATTLALLEADRSKDRFLAFLGHELRNPLAAIVNALAVLRQTTPQTGDSGQMQEIVERQVRHILRMVDDLLDLSRIVAGKMVLHPTKLNLIELVRSAVEDMRGPIEAGELQLQGTFPDHPIWIAGDATRLNQVLANLLRNAAKFTDPGGRISVTVSADPDQKTCRVVVRDTGIGMDPDTLNRAFGAFVQDSSGIGGSRGGLGLGLAIARGLVERHSGQLTAASQGRGQGSTFTLTLPVAAPPSGLELAEDPEIVMRPKRVLVVDDRRDVSYTLRRLLETWGHTVLVAADGPTALALADQFLPQIVFCDIGLPLGMTGYEVAQHLTQRMPGDVYLVAVTGYGKEEDRRRALEAGFNEHLVKPISLGQLQRIFRTAQRGSSAELGV